ncbi:polyisoprenyl-teichoic acid--peptidoglycan teichoic acid transferase TagT [Paraliobacillus ryukyuensis]|uniref:LytR family transcriptional attenuator n=1 Tax=Paraliobacillus ryukyuensis TaxID=200904 RepID=A0A366EE46_9BACI|nr:LCP family protein [Paraliobacillus ryukyuensis]RBP00593.1 LytR family transcriptional attenuator [Paraliobacillus ryukyuensis]
MKKENNISRIKKRKKKHKKRYLFILIPILLLVGAGGTYAAVVWNHAKEIVADSYEEDGRASGSELRDKKVNPTVDDVSILFVGVDQSKKRKANNESNELSDALILATLNKEENSVKMVSIPRDTYVYIPEVGYKTKINHAHAYGGMKATIETVEGLFDIPVDYYVKINFNAFIDVVNELDGITVDVPYEMYEQDSEDNARAIHLLPGEQKLNGEEALALARTRKQDNDIERGKRQQEIIKAMVNKAVSFNTLLNISDLMTAVGDNMSTSMSFNEIKSFVSYGSKGNLEIETLSLKGSDVWADAYYYQLDETDLSEKQEILKEHLGLTTYSSQLDTDGTDLSSTTAGNNNTNNIN